MAKNALPLILFGTGALLLAGGKKKRRRKKSAGEVYEWDEVSVKPTRPPAAAAQTSSPSGKAATSSVWKARQTALAFVAGMKVCNCHPGKVDGIFGPATIAAIIAFQICAGIKPDGKWGPKTDAAMKKMLVDIASGQVKIAKSKPSSKPLDEQYARGTWRAPNGQVYRWEIDIVPWDPKEEPNVEGPWGWTREDPKGTHGAYGGVNEEDAINMLRNDLDRMHPGWSDFQLVPDQEPIFYRLEG